MWKHNNTEYSELRTLIITEWTTALKMPIFFSTTNSNVVSLAISPIPVPAAYTFQQNPGICLIHMPFGVCELVMPNPLEVCGMPPNSEAFPAAGPMPWHCPSWKNKQTKNRKQNKHKQENTTAEIRKSCRGVSSPGASVSIPRLTCQPWLHRHLPFAHFPSWQSGWFPDGFPASALWESPWPGLWRAMWTSASLLASRLCYTRLLVQGAQEPSPPFPSFWFSFSPQAFSPSVLLFSLCHLNSTSCKTPGLP